jgi:predicted SAM-dependent methyltransferase
VIEFKVPEGFKIIELGGGANPRFHPNVDVRQCFDTDGNSTVDFTADFTQPLPITSDEWDAVFASFVLEHLPYPLVPQFLSEVFRILRRGGRAVFVIPNTKRQFEWIVNNWDGWDGKRPFTAASELLFGSQDYPENTHRSYFDEQTITELLRGAGFGNDIRIREYNERGTDMVVEATKPMQMAERILNQFDIPFQTNVLGTNVAPADYPDQSTVPHERGGEEVNRVTLVQSVLSAGEALMCGHVGPRGLRCSLPKNHDGNHSASESF